MHDMVNIINEEPSVHWGFLNVKDKIVLDLGCGQFYSSISTAKWFLDKEADLVIGVDLTDIGLEDPRFIMHTERIASTAQLRFLIHAYQPNIIKCDIEGAEKYFEGIKTMPSVNQFAVEYHDNVTKFICEKAIERWQFPNYEFYQLLGEDINRIGVIHAWRNS